jgi:hypothetical protein
MWVETDQAKDIEVIQHLESYEAITFRWETRRPSTNATHRPIP